MKTKSNVKAGGLTLTGADGAESRTHCFEIPNRSTNINLDGDIIMKTKSSVKAGGVTFTGAD